MAGSCGRALSNNFTLRQLAGWCLRAGVDDPDHNPADGHPKKCRAQLPRYQQCTSAGHTGCSSWQWQLAIALVGLQAALKPANTSGDDKYQKQILK